MSPKRQPSPLSAIDEPVPVDEAPAPMPVMAAPPGPPQVWKAEREPKDAVRQVAIVLAMVFLAISLAVAYYSANSILAIWFEYQYTPIARLVLALAIAAVSVWVVLRLTQKKR